MKRNSCREDSLSILLVDDDERYLGDLASDLSSFFPELSGHIHSATSTSDATRQFITQSFDMVIADIDFTKVGEEEDSGLGLLDTIKEIAPHVVVLLTTGVADRATVFRGGKKGAFDFIDKLLPPEEGLVPTMTRALAYARQQGRIRALEQNLAQHETLIILYRKTICTGIQLALSVLLGLGAVSVLSHYVEGNLYRLATFCIVLLFAAVFFQFLKKFALKVWKLDLSASSEEGSAVDVGKSKKS